MTLRIVSICVINICLFFGSTLQWLSAQEVQDYLVTSGSLASNGTINLYRMRVLSLPVGTSDDQGSGTYSLDLQDGKGQSLYKRHFEMASDSESSGSLVFSAIVPYQSGTKLVVISNYGQVLRTIHVTDNAPGVKVIFPNGGESLSGMQTILWDALDADGDNMLYDIQISVDGGATWAEIASDLTQPGYTWNTNMIPGTTQALVRVYASDGVNTTFDQSDAVFSLPGKPPEPLIIEPANGAVYALNQRIIFKGAAFDVEDGPLEESSLTWEIPAGIFGTGNEVIPEGVFGPGQHIVRFTATDSNGNSAYSSIEITILEEEDSDGDNILNSSDNCPFVFNVVQSDFDGDMKGDACDDSDSDGYIDSQDNCQQILNNQADSDDDVVGDACDNCQLQPNSDQRDTNGDGYGNRCDADLDDSGYVNSIDLGLFKLVFLSSDSNSDINGDGIVNSLDLGLFKQLFFKAPGPSAWGS